MKGKNLEDLLNKKVKVTTFEQEEFIGKVEGYVPAHDTEPEVEEIDILNEKDNKNYSLFENEIKELEIIN